MLYLSNSSQYTRLYVRCFFSLAVCCISSMAIGQTLEPSSRPNVLLIVADDLGYSDLGSFGGEIETPNLDRLAETGIRLSSFYSAPTCSPTRAMLLSGVDSHLAGLGNMYEELAPNQKGKPGYEGHLNDRVVPLPEMLRNAGYRTYMSGKWHLGIEKEQGPSAKGFDRSFALMEGAGGHFNMMPVIGPGKATYRDNGDRVEKLPDDFYSTRFYTDKLIEYLEQDKKDERPFFAYLSFTAPHWPLQAPEESITKYKGRYDAGYDAIYRQRFQRMIDKGLIPKTAKASTIFPGEKGWDALDESERKASSKKMEIYAAMVDDMDVYTGKLLDYLESIGERENTVIIFMSDNGAEGHHVEQGWPAFQKWVNECCDNSYRNMGKADSYIWYGPNWGRVSSGPYKHFKGNVSEGGIRVPALIHHGSLVERGTISNALTTVKDIAPTLLSLAGASHPGSYYKGNKVYPLEGASLLPLINAEAANVHPADAVMGWELFGKKAIRQGPWKITSQPKPYGDDQWRLFNLSNDPAERNNVADQYPDKLVQMLRLWEQYARDKGVIIPDWVSGY